MEQNDNNGFTINVNSPGNFIAREMTFSGTINIGGGGAEHTYTDAEVARALEAIVGKERPIDAKWKWAGAYWWLRWACGWPVDVPRFCRRVQELPFSEALDVKCEYNDIRRVCTLTFMEQDPQKMHAVQPSSADTAQFAACREVALRLAEELRRKTPDV